EHCQKVDDLEEHSHQEFKTGDDEVILVQETLEDASNWNPPSSPTPDREWHKIKTDDKLYKFREDDFKRQDIKDMLLLLVQDKLFNLNLEEQYALNVALKMFTRCIVLQERVEDLQLGVESYQKKINLTRPDRYRSDLRRMTPYTAYPDIQNIFIMKMK
nr:hypothetical protein [Tanacetum cinerariifolium]